MRNNKDVDSLSHTTWRCQYGDLSIWDVRIPKPFHFLCLDIRKTEDLLFIHKSTSFMKFK